MPQYQITLTHGTEAATLYKHGATMESTLAEFKAAAGDTLQGVGVCIMHAVSLQDIATKLDTTAGALQIVKRQLAAHDTAPDLQGNNTEMISALEAALDTAINVLNNGVKAYDKAALS